MLIQHVNNKLQELHDLDLDFAGSDLVVAALMTDSLGHSVTWFLVRDDAHVPEDGECAADPACVTSSSSDNATVIFPGYRASLQNGGVYFVCALVSPPPSSSSSIGRAGALATREVCGDGFVVDDDPPSAGTVSILNANGGFLVDSGRVVVSWSGFSDARPEASSAYAVAALTYSVALGMHPAVFRRIIDVQFMFGC